MARESVASGSVLATTLAQLVAAAAPPLRAWSLIVTVLGDVVVPRGGSIWLGTLAAILGRLGIDAVVVRTALSRLATDGWVERDRRGRNSFYRLTASAQAESQAAARRIYDIPGDTWSGRWLLAIPTAGTPEERASRREELARRGFGRLGGDMMVAPERPGVAAALRADAALVRVVGESFDRAEDCRLAAAAWPLQELAGAYVSLAGRIAELESSIAAQGTALDGLDALALRVWVVHELRRIVLKDPELPATALPPDWPGPNVRRQAGRLWRAALAPSEAWLDLYGRRADGPLAAAGGELEARFSKC